MCILGCFYYSLIENEIELREIWLMQKIVLFVVTTKRLLMRILHGSNVIKEKRRIEFYNDQLHPSAGLHQL
jgi:hypothetical protein